MENIKKCENCVFCSKKPEGLEFLPNNWVYDSVRSKWRGYWPVSGCCEFYTEPAGKTVREVIGEKGEEIVLMFSNFLSIAWNGVDANERAEIVLNQDSAILSDYGWNVWKDEENNG